MTLYHVVRRGVLPVLGALLGLALLGAQASPAQAQPGARCFAETNQCISGPIRAYWERNGGLPVFGFPITPQHEEVVEGRALQVQSFERDRLEIQADGLITAGRLGARLLELRWQPWELLPRPGTAAPPGCAFFQETGHSLCEPFLSYWRNNGGLERFGYAISEPLVETLEGHDYTVQYFERRRMEIHPELPSSPILLGLLGRDVLQRLDLAFQSGYPGCGDQIIEPLRPAHRSMIAPETLGCPLLMPETDVPASFQRFERGIMIWFSSDNPAMLRLGRAVIAISEPGRAVRVYPLVWKSGDPDTPNVTAPAGLYAPWRDFGRAWESDPWLRETLGWAIEPQAQASRVDYQNFAGGLMLRLQPPGLTYAFRTGDDPGPHAQAIVP